MITPLPSKRPESKLMYKAGIGLGFLSAVLIGVVIIGCIVKTVEWMLS